MDKQTNNRKNYGTPYFAMVFLAALLCEIYWIQNSPTDHFMLIGIGIIMLIMGYLTIDGILKIKADSDASRAEQNDMILKAQKAIYIATKKNTKDADIKQRQNLKAVELMLNNMLSSQQALLEEKKPAANNDITALIDQLSDSNAKLAKEVQAAITVNQLVKANADLVRNVKEALSASANNTSSVADLSGYVQAAINSTPTPMVAPAPAPTPVVAPVVTPVVPEPVIIPEPAVIPEPVVVPEPVIIPEPEVIPEPVVIPELEVIPEPVVIPEPEIISEPEIVPEESLIDDMSILADNVDIDISSAMDEEITPSMDLSMVDIENEINLAKMEESETLDDNIIPDEMTPELDAAIDDGSSDELIAEAEAEAASILEATEEEIEIPVIDEVEAETAEAVVEEAPAEAPTVAPIDDSPNRQLTQEEIAALFASL